MTFSSSLTHGYGVIEPISGNKPSCFQNNTLFPRKDVHLLMQSGYPYFTMNLESLSDEKMVTLQLP
jgi:hypothetical protein